MKYGVFLLLVVMACAVVIVPKITGNESDRMSIIASTAVEQKTLETGAKETVKYFKKYKQNLKDEVKIVSVNQSSSPSTLVNKYEISKVQAELVAVGRGFYTDNTVFVNMQIANQPVIQMSTVAHELTHHYQKQLINSTDNLLWLQEGMAEVTAGYVLDESGQTVSQVIKISQLHLPADLKLSKLRSEADWLQAVSQYGAEAVYSYSTIAVRELIAQKSYWSLIEFHNELNSTKDIEKSFKKVFLIELEDFEKKISEDIKENKGNILHYKYY